ncbi:hypothetical protein MRX96_048243, partial [Rhipicephalus microplus]
TKYLVEWMVSLNLDLLNETRLEAVDPVEMMVRGSLDLGVEAIISFVYEKTIFEAGKRVIKIDYSKQQGIWRAEYRSMRDYEEFLKKYGAVPPLDKKLALKLQKYENILQDIETSTIAFHEDAVYSRLIHLGDFTRPYVTSNDWITLFSKYTSGTYTSSDSILRQPHATAIIGKLFESVGKEGLRYLIAWTFYRQLVQLTEPVELLRQKTPSEVCYEHVKRVMNLAIISHYFQSEVPPRMVYQTKRMVTRIRHTFVKAMESSSWISPNARHYAIELLYEITAHAGSPGRRLDPEFIADIYSQCSRLSLYAVSKVGTESV